jgi:hypothetical protein
MEFMERLEGIPASYRWLAIPGFVVLMAALYWYFLYQPYIEEMEALQRRSMLNAKQWKSISVLLPSSIRLRRK